MFTMIGGGMKKLSESWRQMKDVLPVNAKWIKDSVAAFNPSANFVTTKSGHSIEYDILIVAVGLQLNYDKVCLKYDPGESLMK